MGAQGCVGEDQPSPSMLLHGLGAPAAPGTRSLPGVRACFNTLLLKKEKRQRKESKSRLAGAAKQLRDLASLLSFAKVGAAASQAPSELSLWGGTLRYLKSLHPKKQGFFPYIYRAGDAVMSQSRLPGAREQGCTFLLPHRGTCPRCPTRSSRLGHRPQEPVAAGCSGGVFHPRSPPLQFPASPCRASKSLWLGWDSLCLMETCACC